RDAPAGAVTPMHEIAEPVVRDPVVERLDAERLRRRLRRRGAELAPAQLRLDRARRRHRGRADRARDDAFANRLGDSRDPVHRVRASWRSDCNSVAPRRSSRWSPTRIAFAIAVRAGFTALDDGKKLVSTT